MSQYDNTNTIIISRNDRRTQDTHPEFTGSVNVEGKEYFVNLWVKERKRDGGKFFSGNIKPKEKQADKGGSASLASQLDDNIPFAPEWR